MPLPLLDIATILKKENADTEQVVELTKKIQHEIFLKSLQPGEAEILNPLVAKVQNYGITADKSMPRKSIGKHTSAADRRPIQKVSKKRKKQPSLDITRAALVFGSVSTLEQITDIPLDLLPNPSPRSTLEELSTEPKEDKKVDTDTTPETVSETSFTTSEISEDRATVLKNEERLSKKSPHRSSSSRQHIGKRVKKKTQRSRLTSAASVGLLPTEKHHSIPVEAETEEVSTPSSTRTSFETKE